MGASFSPQREAGFRLPGLEGASTREFGSPRAGIEPISIRSLHVLRCDCDVRDTRVTDFREHACDSAERLASIGAQVHYRPVIVCRETP